MAGRILVGISGWAYKSWRGDFYPVGLRPSQQLGYVSERLATVEINASFYCYAAPPSISGGTTRRHGDSCLR